MFIDELDSAGCRHCGARSTLAAGRELHGKPHLLPAGTFEGYGSVFNNRDDGGDLIQPDVFAGVIQRIFRDPVRYQRLATIIGVVLTGVYASLNRPTTDVTIGTWQAKLSGR